MAAGVQMRAIQGTLQYLRAKNAKIRHFKSIIGRPTLRVKETLFQQLFHSFSLCATYNFLSSTVFLALRLDANVGRPSLQDRRKPLQHFSILKFSSWCRLCLCWHMIQCEAGAHCIQFPELIFTGGSRGHYLKTVTATYTAPAFCVLHL